LREGLCLDEQKLRLALSLVMGRASFQRAIDGFERRMRLSRTRLGVSGPQ
jgi:hypothetical protein